MYYQMYLKYPLFLPEKLFYRIYTCSDYKIMKITVH